MTALTRMRLPNGTAVLQLNPAETGLQYRDIVATRAYLQYGLTVEPGDTVVDVGANVGISSLFFHWEAPGVRVVAVEPVPLLHEALEANLREHGVDGVALRCGLASEPGTAELTYYPEVTVMTSLYGDPEHDAAVTRAFLHNSGFAPADVDDFVADRHAAETVDCELRTLSDVLADEGVGEVGLLKVNVEKAERDVLAGVAEEDWPRIRQLTMQVHDLDAGHVAAVRDELAGRGYDVAVDQDPLLAGTDIHDVFAVRR
ncbi:MAG TPA: FkbM family methyltransferase [Solirubrobacteraceae bacterium]|jgi:FkbM family methyltransferase|nr:FkbM family methyltransferase [Solirubrobacteraceae bacterium]